MTLEPERMVDVHTPEQELAIWTSGGDVEPSQLENIVQHLEMHMAQLQDPNVQSSPEIMAKLQRHLAKTYEMAQMQAMAQQQQQGGPADKPTGPGSSPVAGEQAMNAQTGRQAPSGASSGQMGAVPA